jgi:5-methylcytosine-specific restriction endonuclease McrA
MPIRAENKSRYPKDWKRIAARIRERAQGLCEFCGALDRQPHPITRSIVILTVAHIDHTPENCSDENLKALCQRCHNGYDAKERARGIRTRRRVSLGIIPLFPD